jgi:hypothetical protein
MLKIVPIPPSLPPSLPLRGKGGGGGREGGRKGGRKGDDAFRGKALVFLVDWLIEVKRKKEAGGNATLFFPLCRAGPRRRDREEE